MEIVIRCGRAVNNVERTNYDDLGDDVSSSKVDKIVYSQSKFYRIVSQALKKNYIIT